MQNYRNLYLACKPKQLYGPVNYRDFRETSPRAENNNILLLKGHMSYEDTILVGHLTKFWLDITIKKAWTLFVHPVPKMNKNKRFAAFEKHYATFRVNQKTYYDNVKENFITQVNFVLWLWGFTQGRFLFFLTVKWFTIKKCARHNVRTHVRFCQTLKNFGWLMFRDWLLFAALQ